MSVGQIGKLFADMRDSSFLPNISKHTRDHGASLGCRSEAEYAAAWRKHLQRTDLAYFTVIRSREQDRMWYLVAMDNGDVALYNETRKQQWSFLRADNLSSELETRRGHWVAVHKQVDGWQIEPW